MAYRKVDESNLSSLADKIRAKGGTSAGMVFPAGFLSAVDALPDKPTIEPLEVTENGTFTAPSGVDGYSPVTVNVAGDGGDGAEGYTLKCRAHNNSPLITGFCKGLRNIDIDMNNLNKNIPTIYYLGTDQKGGTCTIRNIANHTIPSDWFRQGCVFSEIVFEPYVAPASLIRTLYQPIYSPTEDGSTFVPLDKITVRGLRLDNLSTTGNPFAENDSVALNILWEGTLSNSVSFQLATMFTDESLALLINCLKDFSSTSETRTLTLNAAVLSRLTDDQIAAASGKGWTLA